MKDERASKPGESGGRAVPPRAQPPAPSPQPPASRKQLWARVARWTAAVAVVHLVLVTALMAWHYSRRLAKDPLNSEEFLALKAELAAAPQNEELKTRIRQLDLALRTQYFQQRRLAASGAWLLLGGAVVLLIALRAAATLDAKLPMPEAHATPEDTDARAARGARWSVAAIALVLACGGVGLALGVRSVLDEERPTDLPTARAAGPDLAATGQGPGAGAQAPSPVPSGSFPAPEEVAKNWPYFRGPTGLGISAYENVPTTWDASKGEGIVWKTPVPLEGNSSPVVWKDRIFLTGATDRVRQVYCFDATSGKLLWQQDLPATPASAAKPPDVMGDTGFAAPTPATDGQRVYAMFAIGDLAAFDFTGKLAWVRSLGIPKNPYGHATSLSMVRNLLLVQFDQATAKEAKSKLIAMDSATGNTVWETPRPVPSSWCTPIVIQWQGQEQIVTGGDPWAIAYQSHDGKEIWRVKCLGQDVAASPVFADGIVYVGNANAQFTAIRPDGQGDVTQTHVLWVGEDGLPDTSSPLATKDYVLLLTSSGTLTCYHAKDGKKLWEQDFDSTFKASPALVGKSVYLVGDEGKAWVVEPGPAECKILSEAILGEPCATSPAFQDGRIYLRGKQHLFCIGKK